MPQAKNIIQAYWANYRRKKMLEQLAGARTVKKRNRTEYFSPLDIAPGKVPEALRFGTLITQDD